VKAAEHGIAGVGQQQLIAGQHPSIGREEAIPTASRNIGAVAAEPFTVPQFDGTGAAVFLAQGPAAEQVVVADVAIAMAAVLSPPLVAIVVGTERDLCLRALPTR
jgi:hypothetical protein